MGGYFRNSRENPDFSASQSDSWGKIFSDPRISSILTIVYSDRNCLVVNARPVREKCKVCHATYFTLRFGYQYINNVFAQSWKDMNMNRQIRSAGICKRSSSAICEAVLVSLLWKWIGVKSIAMFCRNKQRQRDLRWRVIVRYGARRMIPAQNIVTWSNVVPWAISDRSSRTSSSAALWSRYSPTTCCAVAWCSTSSTPIGLLSH